MNPHLHSAIMAKSAMELLATHGNKVNLLACCGVDYPHTHPLLIKSGRTPIVHVHVQLQWEPIHCGHARNSLKKCPD